MFGPLLAMRAGHNHSVQLQNELTAPVNDYLVMALSSYSSAQLPQSVMQKAQILSLHMALFAGCRSLGQVCDIERGA